MKEAYSSARHYPRFPVEEPFLTAFMEHCHDRLHLGMHLNVAKETVIDVSKYLKFTAVRCGRPDNLDPKHLYDEVAMHSYLTKLEWDGVQSAGQLTKHTDSSQFRSAPPEMAAQTRNKGVH